MSAPSEKDWQAVDAAGVTEAHKRFEPFVGTFSAEVQIWMESGQEPFRSTGVMTNTLELGGRFLAHNYQGDPGPGPFEGFQGCGYWGYNTVSGKYEGFWIDSASTFMQTEAGEVDPSGRVWNLVGEMVNPQDGTLLQKRSVITLEDRDHHRLEMFFTDRTGNEFRAMEVHYTRRS